MKKILTNTALATLMLYGCILYYVLFNLPGRAMITMSDSMRANNNYSNHINLIPFKTIFAYIKVIGNASTRGRAIWNLAGNLALLLPLGFFFPFFIDRLKNIKPYLMVVTAFIIIIETTQILTMTGSMDIDDFILNLAGAALGYAIVNYTPVCAIHKFRAW
jgi:glycopeptide antibiotics resistance protein